MSPIETEYQDRIVAGRFSIQACGDCGARQVFPRSFCARCGSEGVDWLPVCGRGRVATLTTIHRAPTPEYRARVPYVIALVDLEEGVRVMAHGAPGLAVGEAVALSSHPVGDGHLLRVDPLNRRAK